MFGIGFNWIMHINVHYMYVCMFVRRFVRKIGLQYCMYVHSCLQILLHAYVCTSFMYINVM